MYLLRDYRDPPPECRGAVVALGNFDGVHRGHQEVLRNARTIADGLRAPLGVLVFEPHPRVFFRPDTPPFRLTLLSEKVRQLEAAGVEIVMAFEFDQKMADTSAESFLRDILSDKLGVRHLVVGKNFRYGKDRSGDTALLQSVGVEEGFGVTLVSAFQVDGEICSSSRVRACLREGRPADAAHLLGHWWAIEGPVLAGDKRGRQLGFPTANLPLQDFVEPRVGVYAVRVEVEDSSGGIQSCHDGVANIGRRPTFDKDDVILEVNIFDFSEDIYGRVIRVSLIKFLRPEKKFSGLDALREQIALDSHRAREALASSESTADRFSVGKGAHAGG
jgi:riboflavin kinase/FMN adenylyltransferase